MLQIRDRSENDSVADMVLTDAYMRWALEATEEVVGKQGMAVALREAGLERFIDNYPPESLEPPGSGITYKDYASLSAGLINFYGRPGKSMVIRVGRISARKGIEHQSRTFNLATVLAAKLLPAPTQIKMGLAALNSGFKVMNDKFGQEFKGTIDDGGEYWIYSIETDPCSAGKQSDQPIGWLMEAAIEEAGRQIFGKFFDVEQVACRSMGAPASVWHVPKQPSEE